MMVIEKVYSLKMKKKNYVTVAKKKFFFKDFSSFFGNKTCTIEITQLYAQ